MTHALATAARLDPDRGMMARAAALAEPEEALMCRNIRPLFNFEPPATDEEVRAAALQFVRKVSGTRKPSGKNVAVFERAVEDVAAITRKLVDSLETSAPPKTREEQARKALARAAQRFR